MRKRTAFFRGRGGGGMRLATAGMHTGHAEFAARMLGIGMQAQMHGAGVGGPFDHGLFLFGELTVGHVEDDLDLADAARVGAHGLADLDGGAGHVHAVVPAIDADDGHGAGGQGRGAKVGGAEGLALAVVVLGGVGDEYGTALLVHAFHAQVAEIFGGDVCHGGTPFLPQNALSAPRTQEVCPPVQGKRFRGFWGPCGVMPGHVRDAGPFRP